MISASAELTLLRGAPLVGRGDYERLRKYAVKFAS